MASTLMVMGSDFTVTHRSVGHEGFAEITHSPTGIAYLLVPGATFRFGLTDPLEDELVTVLAAPTGEAPASAPLEDWIEGVRENYRDWIDRAKPALERTVAPLLFGRALLDDGVQPPAGARIPFDYEYEYVASRGGTSRWLAEPPFEDVEATIESLVTKESEWGMRQLLHEAGQLVASSRLDGATERRGGALWGWQDDTFATYVLHVTFTERLRAGRSRAVIVPFRER